MRALLITFCVTSMMVGCGDQQTRASSEPIGSAPPMQTPTPAPPGAPPSTPPPDSTVPNPIPTSAIACIATAPTPRRLSDVQLVNALADIAQSTTADPALAATVVDLIRNKAQFPANQRSNPDNARHGGFTRLDPSLSARHVEAMHAVATSVATEFTKTDARVKALLSNCTQGTELCLTNFIKRVGRLVLRQPLTDAEVAIYKTVAGNSISAASLTRVLAAMIASPNFLFVLERAQPQVTNGCAQLTAHELATRLALHFWNSIPDEALNRDADNGSLLQPDVYAQHVARMVASPRADASLREFFRQWFRLDELTPFDGKLADPKFLAFADGYAPQAGTREAAITEVLDLVSYQAAQGGSLQQVFTDRRSYARTADLAQLYKVPVWNGQDPPPVFSEAERSGLITRIAFTAIGSSDTTLPITRGYRILTGLACQAVPPPPDNTLNPAADLTGHLTSRERTERLTEMPGTTCRGCHAAMLNPWGYALEGFDALGRLRTSETIRDATGATLATKPVNTATQLVLSGQASRAVSNAAQAQQMLMESGAIESCFAREYFRYTFARNNTAADTPLIDALRAKASAGTDLRNLFAAVALRPEFIYIAR